MPESEQQAQELREHIEAEERLGRELVTYAGRWVAVRDHAVVDSDMKLAPLVARCGPEVEVFRVLDAPDAPCIFPTASQVERPDEGRRETICGVICACGPNGEPLACAYPAGHDDSHSWASLPTFGGENG